MTRRTDEELLIQFVKMAKIIPMDVLEAADRLEEAIREGLQDYSEGDLHDKEE